MNAVNSGYLYRVLIVSFCVSMSLSASDFSSLFEALSSEKNLDKNINLDQRIGGKTPLMEAARKGDFKIVRTLLRSGANVDLVDDFKANALTAAIGGYANKALIYLYSPDRERLNILNSLNNIVNNLVIAGSSIDEDYILGLLSVLENGLDEALQDDSMVLPAVVLNKENIKKLKQTFASIRKLEEAFSANTPFNEIKSDINKEDLELFIARKLNKDPYALDALTEYFKDINILQALDTYKDYLKPEVLLVVFITNLRNEALSTNPNLLKAIVTGENSEQFADTPVMKIYKLAQESENKKLGQIIRQWAENAYILSQEMRLKDDKDNEQYRQLPAELVSHITSYLKATD